MANITRNFTAGKMNKMVDDRLVPNGEYIDALNVLVHLRMELVKLCTGLFTTEVFLLVLRLL